MSGVNKVILVGRLGKDPEVREIPGGARVATFSIATSEKYKDKSTGEVKETTDWHNIVAWRGLAEISAKYLHKGDLIYVDGKLKTKSWDKDGVKHYRTEVIADNMTMLGGKNGNSTPASTGSHGNEVPIQEPILTPSASGSDDLPF